MLLTASEVAKLLRIHPNTLYSWRSQGRGPTAVTIGRSLRYRTQDVESWIVEQKEQGHGPTEFRGES